MQTTATLLTPPGRGGIAVISLSGPLADAILPAVFRPRQSHAESSPTALRLGHLVDGEQVIDEAVICKHALGWEINIHGGPAVTKAVLELLVRHGATASNAPAASLHAAHPRWNNPSIGRELLSALPHAKSELVLAALCCQWSDGISRLARSIPQNQLPAATNTALATSLALAAEGFKTMHRLLHPPEIVLAGPPNAGKSTLANLLAGRQVSIVHEQPGTTRDWVRELTVMNGVPVHLTDTAGIWDVPTNGNPLAHQVDSQAVQRAKQAAQKADMIVILTPADAPEETHTLAYDAVFTARTPDRDNPRPAQLRVTTKCDLRPGRECSDVNISAQTGEGIDSLRQAIVKKLGLADFNPRSPMAFTARQAQHLALAAHALQKNDADSARAELDTMLAT